MSKGDAIRRIYDANCCVGEYVVISNKAVVEQAGDYVTAEVKAHAHSRKHPHNSVIIAQVNAEFVSKPHVYEMHGNRQEAE